MDAASSHATIGTPPSTPRVDPIRNVESTFSTESLVALTAALRVAITERDQVRRQLEYSQIWGYGEAERGRALLRGLTSLQERTSHDVSRYKEWWDEQDRKIRRLQQDIRGKNHMINSLQQSLARYEPVCDVCEGTQEHTVSQSARSDPLLYKGAYIPPQGLEFVLDPSDTGPGQELSSQVAGLPGQTPATSLAMPVLDHITSSTFEPQNTLKRGQEDQGGNPSKRQRKSKPDGNLGA